MSKVKRSVLKGTIQALLADMAKDAARIAKLEEQSEQQSQVWNELNDERSALEDSLEWLGRSQKDLYSKLSVANRDLAEEKETSKRLRAELIEARRRLGTRRWGRRYSA